MKIAILDFLNQDPGLSILFENAADYYVFKTEDFTLEYRKELYARRQIAPPSEEIQNITSDNYDTLFVISALYNSAEVWNGKLNPHFSKEVRNYFDITIDIIKSNKFKNVYFFDNYDYDYDPNEIFIENGIYDFVKENNIRFFKRFYSANKIYSDNVFSFPYIMFGFYNNLDIITSAAAAAAAFPPPTTQNRLFFSGDITVHNDTVYGCERNRAKIMQDIHKYMGNFLVYKNRLPYETYMDELRGSRFCLDLHGVGEPNKRTFEILAAGSLRIAQASTLEWNFEDDFAPDTYFTDAADLFEKMKKLVIDEELYARCLKKQNEIVAKYMSVGAIRDYIVEILNEN